MAQAIHLHQASPLKASCQQCSLSNLCLPLAVEENDLERLEDIVQQGKIYNRGEHIFDQSTPMRSCFAVKSGSVKTSIITEGGDEQDRKSTRLNSSHVRISYAVFCLKKKKKHE